MPVFHDDRLAVDTNLEASVAQLAVVSPIVVDTTNGVLETLESQQVLCVMDEVVEGSTQAVLKEVSLQADIELRRRLPLNFLVTDIRELHANLGIVETNGVERSACSIVADAIITADIEACVQTQVVDTAMLGEPRFISQHPSQLYTGEDGPLRAKHLHASISIRTKTAVSLSQHGDSSEILVHVVVVA